MKRVKLQWQTIENYQSFDTAEKNMAHDELLLRQLQPTHHTQLLVANTRHHI